MKRAIVRFGLDGDFPGVGELDGIAGDPQRLTFRVSRISLDIRDLNNLLGFGESTNRSFWIWAQRRALPVSL